jgi:glycosyltransferase involved in cell wall biosynthesis
MRILYDGYTFQMQAAGGINRYFAKIISGLPCDYSPILLAGDKRGANWPHHPKLQILSYRHFRPWRISRVVEKAYLSKLICQKYDLIHPTYYELLAQQEMGFCRSPIVLTVYDMIHERFSESLDPTGAQAALKRNAVLAAQSIICISHHTKKDLIELYPDIEDKIHVIHLASGIDETLSHGDQIVPEQPFFLYVGSRNSYKNFDGFLNSCAKVAQKMQDFALCVVGPAFTEDEQERITELGLTRYVKHYGQPDDHHLAKLYRCSAAFVYPSLYEGFGIPPLEAMSCGAVVVAASNSSIPEVVGDAALLFDAMHEDELTDILKAVLSHAVPREPLIAKGFIRAQQFTWEKTVTQTLEVYSSTVR